MHFLINKKVNATNEALFSEKLKMKLYLVTKCNGRNSLGILENIFTDLNLAQLPSYTLPSYNWTKKNYGC